MVQYYILPILNIAYYFICVKQTFHLLSYYYSFNIIYHSYHHAIPFHSILHTTIWWRWRRAHRSICQSLSPEIIVCTELSPCYIISYLNSFIIIFIFIQHYHRSFNIIYHHISLYIISLISLCYITSYSCTRCENKPICYFEHTHIFIFQFSIWKTYFLHYIFAICSTQNLHYAYIYTPAPAARTRAPRASGRPPRDA